MNGTTGEFVELFAQTAQGSLDVMTRRRLATLPAHELAREELDYYRSCPGERDWWQVATGSEGVIVCFVIPSATPYHRNVGYLGVLPHHRGNGYVHELLQFVTRLHAASGATRITAKQLLTRTTSRCPPRSWAPVTTWSNDGSTSNQHPESHDQQLGRIRYCRGQGAQLQLEMETQGVVKLRHQVGGNTADHWTQPFDGNRPDLFSLRLGVDSQARFVGWQEHLEGEHPGDSAGDRNDGDHAAAESGGGGVGAGVTDDDGGYSRSPVWLDADREQV